MAFCISGAKQYRQQRAAFLTGLCICRQHCAVNRINVGKIIRCLRLPQFAVRQTSLADSFNFLFFMLQYARAAGTELDDSEGVQTAGMAKELFDKLTELGRLQIACAIK